ncbi:hypothetical protein [Vibrio harveyi]|uniref:hypothetical protein n=1 Tax=Vibrio harveyi TaxID=669 RepID=UPI0006823F11|nr:hypothetical protein [Vibrio harveyi]PNM43638.1 hypothetical protein AL469_027705 [Vibrio harveyi]
MLQVKIKNHTITFQNQQDHVLVTMNRVNEIKLKCDTQDPYSMINSIRSLLNPIAIQFLDNARESWSEDLNDWCFKQAM